MSFARLLIATDFDGTITVADTTPLLPRSPELLSPLSEAYLEDIKNLTSVPQAQRRNVEAELAHLARLAEADRASVERVSASGILAGPIGDRLSRAAAVKLRPGWHDFVACAQEAGWHLKVISVNWSAAFIQRVLADSPPTVDINANEADETGRITGGLHSCADKGRLLKELRQRYDGVVYVGDSTGDLQALLDADIGIVLGESLPGILDRIGVQVVSVPTYVGQTGARVTAKDWTEVLAVVRRFAQQRTSSV